MIENMLVCVWPEKIEATDARFEKVLSAWEAKKAATGCAEPFSENEVRSLLTEVLEDIDPLRGTGRSTAAMLQCISQALLNPDEWVEFFDHAPNNRGRIIVFATSLKVLAERIELTIDVEIRAERVFVRSPIERLRASRNS